MIKRVTAWALCALLLSACAARPAPVEDGSVSLGRAELSEIEIPFDTDTPDSETPSDTGASDNETPLDTGASDYETPLDTGASNDETPLDTGASDDKTPLDTGVSNDETPPDNETQSDSESASNSGTKSDAANGETKSDAANGETKSDAANGETKLDAANSETRTESDADAANNALALAGRTICIDPGHGVTPLIAKGKKAPVSPLSDELKPMYTSGAEGAHQTEEQLNLKVGRKLRDALQALGADVILTRDVSEIALTNQERCEIAAEGGADVLVHIHADGVDNSSVHGVSVLVPKADLLGTPSILDESVRLGQLMVDCVAETTGAQNRGISPRSDMTGFNFSTVPTVLIEMGFMSNPEEDALMETDEYQNKIVDGMTRSLLLWYGVA